MNINIYKKFYLEKKIHKTYLFNFKITQSIKYIIGKTR
jgi:hypothetical protein